MKPLVILVAALVPNFCLAAENIDGSPRAVVIDSKCRQDRHDKFDLGWRFTENSKDFAGKCVNTTSVRALVMLPTSEEDHLRFANFYHDGKYWEADWSEADAPEVQYFGVHFNSGVPFVTAGHTELHFFFPQGLKLISQNSSETAVIQNAVISWEATYPNGEEYNLFTGIQDNFALTGRLKSLEATVKEQTLPDGTMRVVDVYDLSLSKREASTLFKDSVIESEALGPYEFYLTLGRNCTSMLFDTIDAALKLSRPALMKDVSPFVTSADNNPIIGPSYNALLARKLINPGVKTKTLQEVSKEDGN
jgi:hypothetical protein